MKKELKRLDDLIEFFKRIVVTYPDSPYYKDAVNRLETERANLVSNIGKKK